MKLVVVVLMLVSLMLWPIVTRDSGGTASAAQQPDSVIEYWALGDSIAAGTGLGDDANGVDATPCKRSWDRAYPQRVAERLLSEVDEVSFPSENFLACSGAHVLWNAQAEVQSCQRTYPGNPDCENKWLRNQVTTVVEHLEEQRLSGEVPRTLITITAGANDFEYTDPFTVYQAITWGDDWFGWYVKQREDAVFWGLLGQISRLLAYENVSVVVTDVYNPFNENSFLFNLPGSRCSVVSGGSPSPPAIDCHQRTVSAVQAMNDAIWLAVGLQFRPGRVQVASIYDLFEGHGSPTSTDAGITPCGYAPPSVDETWIQYATDPNSNSFPFASNGLVEFLIPGATQWSGDCIHPNDEGAEQIAGAIVLAASSLLD